MTGKFVRYFYGNETFLSLNFGNLKGGHGLVAPPLATPLAHSLMSGDVPGGGGPSQLFFINYIGTKRRNFLRCRLATPNSSVFFFIFKHVRIFRGRSDYQK